MLKNEAKLKNTKLVWNLTSAKDNYSLAPIEMEISKCHCEERSNDSVDCNEKREL